ncbi:MAG: sensor histidine kinase [Aggregatilineales bacterium]
MTTLTMISIPITISIIVISTLMNVSENAGAININPGSVFIVVALSGCYYLSRSGYHKFVARILAFTPIIAIFALRLTSPDAIINPSTLNYTLLGIIVAGLLMSARGIAFTGLVIIVMVIIFQMMGRLSSASDALRFIFLTILATSMMVGTSYLREMHQMLLSRIWQELEKSEEELRRANELLEQRVIERTLDLKKVRDEALAAKRVADENSRLKSEFLSIMSHELRTPMNAIRGFTGIMLNKMAGVEYNDKVERYLLKIQANGERLLNLINDFLDLSRIESGRLELTYQPVSPVEMANSWYDNLSVLAENKKIDFDLHIDSRLPEIIYGDEEMLSRIAVNLVGNAIKFTDEGSVILSLEKHGEQMALKVQDTGIGIPSHAKDFIFEEFRQVDMSSQRKYGGTGLGLSIVQKLTQAMNGTITLESDVNAGSTFTVLLPIHIESQADISAL